MRLCKFTDHANCVCLNSQNRAPNLTASKYGNTGKLNFSLGIHQSNSPPRTTQISPRT